MSFPKQFDAKLQSLEQLRSIPGIGVRLAEMLLTAGIHKIDDLNGKNPEKLYRQLEKKLNRPVDRCVLYTFRCAVYYASNTKHDPQLLKWWHWKDKND